MSISRRDVLRSGAGLISAAGFAPLFAQPSAPTVNTRYGQVRGYTDNDIEVFKGIRYGAETASRRFQPPLPPQAWDKVVDCFEYGASSPQDRTSETISEDCLFLNVWTPAVNDSRKRPVMFYIHGGAYNHGSGSSPLYDGSALARHGDVVVVTVNHRLNAFGYLYLQRLAPERFPDSGNCGQLDLVLALKWVQDNIAAFGGDPEKVLAFGQSGGGAKIATMMAMPAAKGLFQRAASMSGQQVTASGPTNATQRTMAYLDALNIHQKDVDQLADLPVEKLVNGLSARDPVLTYDASVYFGPVLDMRSLTRHPFYPDAAPQSAHIPMIIGNTHDETRAFLRDPAYYDLTWEEVPELLVPNMRVDIRPEYVVDEYRRIYPDYTPSQLFFAATTAARSWRGAIIEAEVRAQQRGAGTFVYQLDFQNPVKPELGAPHTLDIPLVFRNLDAQGSIAGTGRESRAVSAMMSEAFISFASTGVPNSSSLPEWTDFTLPDRATMVFDVPPRMVNDPRGAERRIFERVPYVQPGT
ncbi:MAG: carboxylesterase/lipase family protein [Woeseiaceae bacterium]